MGGEMFQLSPGDVREYERSQREQQQTGMRAVERAIAPLNDRETRELMTGLRNFVRAHQGATTPQMAQEALGYLQRMRDEGTAFGSNPARDQRIHEATRNLFETGMRATLGPQAGQMAEYTLAVMATPTDAQTILRNLEVSMARNGPLNQEQAAQTIVGSIGSIIAREGESAYHRLQDSYDRAGVVNYTAETRRAQVPSAGNQDLMRAVLKNHAPSGVAEYFQRETVGLGDQRAAERGMDIISNMRSVLNPQEYTDVNNMFLGTMALRGIYPGSPEIGDYRINGVRSLPIEIR